MLNTNNIQENVLKKIHEGAVSMHSRTYFVLRTLSITLAALITLALAFFAFSFIYFSVQESGSQFLLGFSQQGILTFFALFPWSLLLLALAFLVALELVLRNFSFGYRTPVLRTFLWVVLVGILGSVLFSFTPIHSILLNEADNDQLPVLGPLYKQVHGPHREHGVYRGFITTIHSTRFEISYNDSDHDSDDGTWTVYPPRGYDLRTLSVGDNVYIAGRLFGGVVYAYGISIVASE